MGSWKLLFPLILEYVALLDVERTLNRSEFIHIKWTFHSSKHDFFQLRPKTKKYKRIKVLHEEWKRYFFSTNKWNTYHKFPFTAVYLTSWILGTLRSNDADGDENVKKKTNNRFHNQNNNFARASHFFVHFFAHFCMTATWKCLISHFMEYVNKQRRNFISLSELGYGSSEFNSRRVRLHLTK